MVLLRITVANVMKNNKCKLGQGKILLPFVNTYKILLRKVAHVTGPTQFVVCLKNLI